LNPDESMPMLLLYVVIINALLFSSYVVVKRACSKSTPINASKHILCDDGEIKINSISKD